MTDRTARVLLRVVLFLSWGLPFAGILSLRAGALSLARDDVARGAVHSIAGLVLIGLWMLLRATSRSRP
jgi:hypothetical protein